MHVTSRGAPRTGLPFVLPVSFDKIDNNNNNKSQDTSHGDLMYAFLGCYLAIQTPLKSLPGACDVTSFSPCTDSSHELRDLQHCMSEQIVLHVFKAITAASCVDIIVNQRLNKYN